jgi:hypothetical protein
MDPSKLLRLANTPGRYAGVFDDALVASALRELEARGGMKELVVTEKPGVKEVGAAAPRPARTPPTLRLQL